jgi:low affinity Fe/Cu permease
MIEPDPLSRHLEQSRKMGWFMVVMLGIVLVVYMAAVLVSGWNHGVIFAGAVVILIGIVLAYRTYRADILETDRLLDEGLEALREDSE